MSMQEPILLLGSSGMLGRAWARCLSRLNIPYFAPSRQECNFLRPEAMCRFLENLPVRTIINCVGFTNVDGAEKEQDAALAINAHAAGVLAEHCHKRDILLVHYSTDYIFDGQSLFGYRETAEANPCNFYGRTKLLGEKLIVDAGCIHLIIRTSWLYSHECHNFVRTIAKKIRAGDPLTVVDDQVGRPTHVDSLAELSLRLCTNGHTGTFNVTDSGICSWFEFALEIRRQLGAETEVSACSSSNFKTAAERPAFSVLDLSKLIENCGRPPHWTVGLRKTLGLLDSSPPRPKSLAVQSRSTTSAS